MRIEFTTQAPGPSPHAYNDPDLSPIEFLQAVYRDASLPMSIRIDAARGLLPYTEPRPARIPSSDVSCTIVIGGLGPCDTDRAQGPPADPTRNHSENPDRASKTLTHSGEAPAPVNIETTSNPPFLPEYLQPQQGNDYSTPPTPAELQEIKAAINALRPDLSHLPVPEPRFCECGHWVFGYYSCCSAASRKLN